MKSFIRSNTFGLMLASVGLLSGANAVLAAEPQGDAQQQARDLLSGTVDGQSRFADVSSAVSSGDQTRLDPQEQARTLILGESFSDTAQQVASVDSKADAMPLASVQDIRSDDIDGQKLAQRMLLGEGA